MILAQVQLSRPFAALTGPHHFIHSKDDPNARTGRDGRGLEEENTAVGEHLRCRANGVTTQDLHKMFNSMRTVG